MDFNVILCNLHYRKLFFYAKIQPIHTSKNQPLKTALINQVILYLFHIMQFYFENLNKMHSKFYQNFSKSRNYFLFSLEFLLYGNCGSTGQALSPPSEMHVFWTKYSLYPIDKISLILAKSMHVFLAPIGRYSFPHIYNLAMQYLAIIIHAMYKIAYTNQHKLRTQQKRIPNKKVLLIARFSVQN